MAGFEVRDLTRGFGAEIVGFDPERDWTGPTKARLKALFEDRGALVFRDLDIDFAFQDTLCRALIGDDTPGRTGDRAEMRVSNKEEDGAAPKGRLMFHADMMWHPEPFRVLSLYGLDVAPGSARTSVADSALGWRTLPAALRARLEGLHARHQTGQARQMEGDDLSQPQRAEEVTTVKPIPGIHPATGDPLLYVSQQTTRQIVELEEDESEALLQEAFAHLYGDDVVYWHDWRNGDLLILDNIRLQHGRETVTYDQPARTLRKVIAPMPKIKVERPRYARA